MRRHRLLVLVLTSAVVSAACDASVLIGRKQINQPPEMPGGEAPDAAPDTAPPSADTAPDSDGPAPPVDTLATVLWSTSLESGDFSDWSLGGAVTGGTYQQRVTASVSDQRAHTGSHAIQLDYDTADGTDHMAEFYRRVEPGPAYYSAWFLLPEARAPTTYWTLLYFFTEGQAGNSNTRRGLWDVNLGRQAIEFFNETNRRTTPPTPRIPYPIGQWFHLEAYFAYEPPRNGHIIVWQDGQPLIDVPDLGVAPSENLYWGIGSDTDGLTPSSFTMYVDDAAISTARLGP
jgi:hypothetical protein